jgi:hypothetical protein
MQQLGQVSGGGPAVLRRHQTGESRPKADAADLGSGLLATEPAIWPWLGFPIG